MKRFASIFAIFAATSYLAACGDPVGGFLDGFGGGTGDMAMGPAAFRLPSGVYKVTAVRPGATDTCKIASDPMLVGRMFAVTNTRMPDVLKFGSVDAMTMNTAAADVGTPPQSTQGLGCTAKNMPDVCATEPNVVPFGSVTNKGSLVRDNIADVPGETCKYKRHVHNLITLTADGKFTAKWTGGNSAPMMCMTDPTCTSEFEWDLEFVKEFGK